MCSTALLHPCLFTVHRRLHLLSHHLMHSPWQSLTSAILRVFLTLPHTPLPMWSHNLQGSCGRLRPRAQMRRLQGHRHRCSEEFSPLPHPWLALQRPRPFQVPHTSIARSSLDPHLQAKVIFPARRAGVSNQIHKDVLTFSFLFFFLSDQEEHFQ